MLVIIIIIKHHSQHCPQRIGTRMKIPIKRTKSSIYHIWSLSFIFQANLSRGQLHLNKHSWWSMTFWINNNFQIIVYKKKMTRKKWNHHANSVFLIKPGLYQKGYDKVAMVVMVKIMKTIKTNFRLRQAWKVSVVWVAPSTIGLQELNNDKPLILGDGAK